MTLSSDFLKMLKYLGLILLTISIIFFLNLRTVKAAEPESTVKTVDQELSDITPLSVLKFSGGLVFAFMIHEAGHLAVAGVTGTPTTWKVGDAVQPISFTERSTNRSASWALNAAGLVAQAGCSEFILFNNSIDKNSSFTRGMMFWNIVNPIAYAVDYWLINRTNRVENNTYYGDLSGIEHYSNKTTADVFAGTMVAISAFQAYRYAKTQTWVPDWIKGNRDLDRVGLVPLTEGGALLSYRVEYKSFFPHLKNSVLYNYMINNHPLAQTP